LQPSYNRGGGIGENTETAQVGVPIAEKSIIAEPAKSADAEVLAGNQATRSACLIFNPVAGQSNRRKTLQPFSKFCSLKSI